MVIGVNVLVKDFDCGIVIDFDGQFFIFIVFGIYFIQIFYIGFQILIVFDVEVVAGEVNVFGEICLGDDIKQLQEVVVIGKVICIMEVVLMIIKKKVFVMLDGIFFVCMQLMGDVIVVEVAKCVIGVFIEGGKYVYVCGLGDCYFKMIFNGVDILGLDFDWNIIQMDIFFISLIDNLVVSKNFMVDMLADFIGGLLNIEIKDFFEEKFVFVFVSLGYNFQMNFINDFFIYDGGGIDFFGFDDGFWVLFNGVGRANIFIFISGNFFEEVGQFICSFNFELGVRCEISFFDYSVSVFFVNQLILNNEKEGKFGYILFFFYCNDYIYYDDVFYGEYQWVIDLVDYEMIYVNDQFG